MPDDRGEPQEVSIPYDNSELINTSHEFIRTYIRHIDQKASILLTLLLAVLSIFGNALRTGAIELTLLEFIATGLAAFCAAISIILCTWVVYPRANLPDSSGYIYWEKILLFGTPERLSTDLKDVSNEEALDEIARDTFVISAIARNKYETLRWAVKITFIGGIFASVAVMNTFFIRMHEFTSTFNEPIIEEPWTAGASLLLTLVFLLIVSWFIGVTDDQIDGIWDFWRGQYEQLTSSNNQS